MAIIASLLVSSVLTPMVDVSTYDLRGSFNLTNGLAAAGDNIQCFTIQRNGRLHGAHLKALASLGVGTTLQLQRNRGGVRINLTAATTAGAASYVNSNAIGPVDVLAGDIIEILVGGANITAASAVEVDLLLQH
ncbi:MAG TPA: hypothetical protein VGR19_02230 [Allosphingosinicella sp.]|nr:hypothetical protein [Allosphingosinicella sp.]